MDSMRLKISDSIRVHSPWFHSKKVTLNWDKASEYVEANCRDEIEKVRDSLKRMMKECSDFMKNDPEAFKKAQSYLPTHYFDRVGRFTNIYEDASEGRTIIAGKAMVDVIVAFHAQVAEFGLEVATDALEQWKRGDHDT